MVRMVVFRKVHMVVFPMVHMVVFRKVVDPLVLILNKEAFSLVALMVVLTKEGDIS